MRPSSTFLYLDLSSSGCIRVVDGGLRLANLCKDMDTDQALLTLFGTKDVFDENSKQPFRFSRTSLLEASASGLKHFSATLRLEGEDGGSLAVAADVMLTGAVEGGEIALIHLSDITCETETLTILNETTEDDYEFMTLIDAETGSLRTLKTSPFSPIKSSCQSFADLAETAATAAATQTEAQRMRGTLMLDCIKERLEHLPFCTFCFQQKCPDGQTSRIRWKFSYSGGMRDRITLAAKDITQQFDSETDQLTGLFCRQKFNFETRFLLDSHREIKFALLRLDLDRFKAYNDLFGEEAGDALLKDLAEILTAYCPIIKPCVLGRIQADHFAFCLPLDKVRNVATEIENAHWLQQKHPEFRFTIRAGIYSINEPAENVSLMCDRALMALRSIKSKDSANCAWYSTSMRSRLIDEQELISELTEAFNKDQFCIFLQPQVNIVTGEIVGAEALARWNHPTKGIIPPSVFIPVLERRGHILELDRIIWEKACRLLSKWKETGAAPLPVSVNIARSDFVEPLIVEILKDLLKKYDLKPEFLHLEITETAFFDKPERIIATVKRLRAEGFKVEMDDFGSGASSLNTLKDVSTDMLKLDMRFFSLSGDACKSGIILNSIINMAHWLNIPVIAEGVENTQHAEYLKTIGCILAQGYLYAKPMPSVDFERLVKNGAVAEYRARSSFSSFSSDEFWNPRSQTSLVFSNFIGPAGVFEFSHGHIRPTRCNAKLFAMFGLERTDPVSRNFFTVESLAPESREKYIKTVMRVASEEDEEHCDVKIFADFAPGPRTPKWVCLHMRRIAVRDDCCMIFSYVEDISKRKELENYLRISRDEMELALFGSGNLICSLDIPKRRLRLSNEYAAKHKAPRIWENIPYGALGKIADEDHEAYCNFYKKIIAGSPAEQVEVRIKTDSGKELWELLSSVTVYGEDKTPQRAIITCSDINLEMKRAAENERNKILSERKGTCIFDYNVLDDTCTLQINTFENGIIKRAYKKYRDFVLTWSSLHEQDRTLMRSMLDRASTVKCRGTLEFRCSLLGTGMRWSRADYASLAARSGRIYRVVGLIEDIDSEKNYGVSQIRLN